jgi:hypothetical protein
MDLSQTEIQVGLLQNQDQEMTMMMEAILNPNQCLDLCHDKLIDESQWKWR